MRITKEPEVRRQEILDAALRLFGEKGYEKTSIADIAKAVGVAQGLCYRYFPSKEALFDSVIEQYADLLTEPFVQFAKENDKPLCQVIEEMPATMEDQNSRYYALFHGAENARFHVLLSLRICEKLVPLAEQMLQKARERGELAFDDPHTAAVFCVYGQLGTLQAEHLTREEKLRQIRAFLRFALHL